MTTKTIKQIGLQKYSLMGRSFTERGASKKVKYLKENVTPIVMKEKVGRRYKVWMGTDF